MMSKTIIHKILSVFGYLMSLAFLAFSFIYHEIAYLIFSVMTLYSSFMIWKSSDKLEKNPANRTIRKK